MCMEKNEASCLLLVLLRVIIYLLTFVSCCEALLEFRASGSTMAAHNYWFVAAAAQWFPGLCTKTYGITIGMCVCVWGGGEI